MVCDKMQIFSVERNNFATEHKCFVNERKDSQGNMLILRENANVLQEMQSSQGNAVMQIYYFTRKISKCKNS